MESQIHSEVQKEVDQSQREFFLREQLKTIQKELGEIESGSKDVDELREKIDQAGMPEAVAERAHKELERLHLMPSARPRWASSAPTSSGWSPSLVRAHRGQPGHQSARTSWTSTTSGWPRSRSASWSTWRCASSRPRCAPHPVLRRPPGVGKTSLGRSIAAALGRKFVRVSLGGVRDEAEIRGHRRTYVGALPGRIIQTMRQAGTVNPVFMLDEVDKLGMDFRGDPSSALLEVLDPEQNVHFSDHYLEVPYDLSQVIFIATANQLDPSRPLRDRMEVIELAGYVEEEKLAIARRFLVPRQLAEHGLTPAHLRFTDGALRRIIREYTREAGVRNLEREVANICRKVARGVADAPARRPPGGPLPGRAEVPTAGPRRGRQRRPPRREPSRAEQERGRSGPVPEQPVVVNAGALPATWGPGASPQAWPRSRTRWGSPPASPGAPWGAT